MAIATVIANGRKSSPTIPAVRPIGRNTATVAMVEEEIAPPTSRTAVTIADIRSSP